jgi:hypothetical protein
MMFENSEYFITPMESLYFSSTFHHSIEHSKANAATLNIYKKNSENLVTFA